MRRTQDKIDRLEERKREIKGAIAEQWRWHDTVKDISGYGHLQFDGKSKVLKLPTLGSPAAIKEAIEDREKAIDGEDEAKVVEIRTDKARGRSQRFIDAMDGRSPDQAGDD